MRVTSSGRHAACGLPRAAATTSTAITRAWESSAAAATFVVLRASGTDEYNDYIFGLCRCDSVETIVFEKGAATADPFVIETIRNAEAVWIAGGDQSNYIRYWKDTPVEDAINFVAAKPAPVGGTSAGMAVLGEYVYSAEGKESLTSEVALGDPYAPDLTLARGFLSLPRFENIVTDQHLQERDRIGRTVALLARLQKDGWARESASDRGRSRNRPTCRSVGRLGRGFFDGRPPDTLCLFPGVGGCARSLRARQAPHDRRDRSLSPRSRRALRSRKMAWIRRRLVRAQRPQWRPTIVARKQLLSAALANWHILLYAHAHAYCTLVQCVRPIRHMDAVN